MIKWLRNYFNSLFSSEIKEIRQEITDLKQHAVIMNSQFRYLQLRLDKIDCAMNGDSLRKEQQKELDTLGKTHTESSGNGSGLTFEAE